MKYEIDLKYERPTDKQLSHLLNLTYRLRNNPEGLNGQEKQQFVTLILKLSPDELTPEYMDILSNVFPDEWKSYCEFHAD